MFKQVIVFLKRQLGVVVIAAVFIVSAIAVYLNQHDDGDRIYTVRPGDTIAGIASNYRTTAEALVNENYPDLSGGDITPGFRMRLPRSSHTRTITIRIAHWQLEPGFRDGIEVLAKEYRKLHPDVRIIQSGIPFNTYGQWFSTQMVGGAPPDLIQVGYVPYHLLIGYFMRYFTPLTEYINEPNPYNAENEFRDTPLRDTTKDGLRACYYPEIQEYMTVGITMHLTRMAYNKTLLKKITGSDIPPATFGEFLNVCALIKKSNTAPLANSGFHMAHILENNWFQPLTSKARDVIDFNHDCSVSAVEQYIGMKTGLIGLDHPSYRAKFDTVAAVGRNSPPGFSGLNRDDAVLMFIQKRAVFIPSWTGDINTLVEQGRDNGFEVGVCDFPLPGPADPGAAVSEGPGFENAVSGTWFGCATPANDPERKRAAIDFLMFMLSKENNIKLNRMTGWIPCIKGSKGEGVLADITPHADGVTPGLNLNIGGESSIKMSQLYALLQLGEMSYEAFKKEFTPFYLARGYRDYLALAQNQRRAVLNDEKIASVQRARLFLGGAGISELLAKYRITLLRAIVRNIDASNERKMITDAEKGLPIRKAYEHTGGNP
ncbi:MAG: extracellular solute-binding protein [Spirochaetes bacterium]|nr:extracellular solute-binding protein [Spirochaetota bacterium]